MLLAPANAFRLGQEEQGLADGAGETSVWICRSGVSTLCAKVQIVNILGFGAHKSVLYSQFLSCKGSHVPYVNKCSCVPIKLYLEKQVAGWI